MQYEVKIGLEVHAQLLTKSKMFCGCSTKFGVSPNSNTCPVCLGLPGVLPVLNYRVVDYAIRAALATNCYIASRSILVRKNYFYPDLPKNYQISQFELPIAKDGWLDIEIGKSIKRVRISRLHIEEDAGKLIHDFNNDISYIDYNRTGIPLIEIVSTPDISTSEEAAIYLESLRDILIYLKICDGNMEEGSFRCDANISLTSMDNYVLGTKVEIKNMNSIRYIVKSLNYEIRRQQSILDSGGDIIQETRLWDSVTYKTFPMRSKEEASDYRYFPDPDLLPLIIDKDWIITIRAILPELPNLKRVRFIQQYKLDNYDINILIKDQLIADYFESLVKAGISSKIASQWIITELFGLLNSVGKKFYENPVKFEDLVYLLQMLEKNEISGKIAKKIFFEMFITGVHPSLVIKNQQVKQINDVTILDELIKSVILANPQQVEQYRCGKKKLIDFFIGQIMKKTNNQANPVLAVDLFNKLIKE